MRQQTCDPKIAIVTPGVLCVPLYGDNMGNRKSHFFAVPHILLVRQLS